MKFTAQLTLMISLVLLSMSINAKPLPSLSMKMNWVNGVAYEQSVKIQLEINSQISSKQVNVSLDLPKGVTLQDGSSLPIKKKIEKGQPLRIDFMVYIEKDAVGEIKAEASIGEADQVYFRASSLLVLENPSASRKTGARSITPPAFQHTERNGIKLREYQLP